VVAWGLRQKNFNGTRGGHISTDRVAPSRTGRKKQQLSRGGRAGTYARKTSKRKTWAPNNKKREKKKPPEEKERGEPLSRLKGDDPSDGAHVERAEKRSAPTKLEFAKSAVQREKRKGGKGRRERPDAESQNRLRVSAQFGRAEKRR